MYRTEKTAILLATYNGEKYISEQIESILEQSDVEWMLYIHDDGSTDRTVEIIEKYAKMYPRQICIVDGAPTGGAKQNFFYLFSCIEAPYYMCCDQDDVWLPEKIEITKKEMVHLEKDDEEKPCLVFTELKVVDENLDIINEKMSIYQGLDCKKLSVNRAIIQNVVTGCTMMVNRALREEFMKITDYTDVLMHDWWAFLVAARFGKIVFIEDATILYRQHGNNGVGARDSGSPIYLMKRMLQGEEIKKSLADTRAQAKLFVQKYGESKDSLISQYAQLSKSGKMKRLRFYIEKDVKKSTFARNIGLWIWG